MKNYGEFEDDFEIPADYVNALVLTGTTAETFTVPSSGTDVGGRVRLAGNAAFYYKHTNSAGSPTAVAPAADVTDGTASIYVPVNPGIRKLKVQGGDKISVVMAAGGIITAEYWKD